MYLSVAKIVQTECKKQNLFELFAEVQPILGKDSANRMQRYENFFAYKGFTL